MKKTGFRVITALAIVAVVMVAMNSGLKGAKADTITIIPPKFELFGNPGDIINEKLRVRNETNAQIEYSVAVEDFVAQGDQGGINLIEDPKSAKNSYSLANWVTFEPHNFSVAPDEEKDITVNVRIPKNGEPGGHYASIVVKRAGEAITAGSGATVQSHINSLILLRVSGDVTEKLAVENFRTENQYYQYGPVKFVLKSKNSGNVHVVPTGKIIIKNMFGKKVKELPLNQANVLPGASRSVTTIWDTKNLVGRYTADLISSYGQQTQPLMASTSFIVFPVYLIAVIIATIAILFLFITQRKKVKRFINRLTKD